ncbi:adenylate kinase 9-like [Episyrphus balteatus]|uniref:adenylate kinase 9-like n=1 Tax=Episyrphus balteatus TaxID=286459 RepID=UPI002484F468|nr:adenylate kinase 9-like [Episyrphus balteatus]
MSPNDIHFTCALPKNLWIEDIIADLLNKLPAKIFDELQPWGSIITQYPFIHKFTIAKAMETIYKVRSERTILNEPIFPKDCRDSEDNLKQFIEFKPIRIMITGDTNSSFCEIGQLLAKEFKTFLITPEELIQQEIIRKSNIGVWLNDILNMRKAVPAWIVMKLLEVELEKEKYSTKGFILTGFPIVSNLNTNSDVYDLQRELNGQEFIFSEGSEDEILKNCVQKQLDFIRSLCCRPDYIIYLDTNNYTKKFTQTIEVFQKFILFYFRENVIRIDSRIGADATFSSIKNRFKYINYKLNYECFVMNECEKDTMSLEELCDTEKVLPNYRWWISKFGQICPVNLYHGRLRLCDSKFPVRYLSNIFLCLSQENRTQFVENPGKYMNLRPKCRIAVIGPHKSGKSTLSRFLAKFLKADIYKSHIQKSHEIYKNFDLTEKIKDLNDEFVRESSRLKQNKIQEWSANVLNILNDIVSKALEETQRNPNFDLFISKKADQYFQNTQTSKTSDEYTKNLVLEDMIFEKSLENITSESFLSWLESKTKTELLYPYYVIDSAPLDIDFWMNLLRQDELPDCVFFLKISSIKKFFDIYSLKHNICCVNENHIYNTLCSKFLDFKNVFNASFEDNNPKNSFNLESVQINSNFLIEKRHKNAMKFIEKYEEIKMFLQSNNIKCIDVDISKQTWTQSILNALIEYMSIYQPKAESENYIFDNEMEAFCESASLYSSIETDEESTESHYPVTNYNYNYGSCLDWCPVSLCKYKILKKGNPIYSAQYMNKIYIMHSRADLSEFLSNPMLYARSNFSVPPPRIFIIGLNHRNKNNFAENLASSLNVESFSYKQNLTTMPFNAMDSGEFPIQHFRKYYNKIKDQFLEELRGNYEKGVVVFGFPFLLEQFNDLIENNLHPECVLMFDDKEETLQAFYRYFGRFQMMQVLSGTGVDLNEESSPNVRASSITSYIDSLPQKQKLDIELKSYHLMQLFQQDILKIEEQCLKLGIPILKVPKTYKLSKQVHSLVETINNHRHREALFESVKEITMHESEVLLNSGYYRFSRFKYSCPVDVSRLMTLNQFEGLRLQGKVYPCIYLDFIYFICGKKNLKDFKWNPLAFINTCNPPQLQDPIRIAVFGASKSDVSTICHTAANEFGLKILSPKHLRDHTDSAVIDLLKMEKSSTPNGIILDNVPLTPTLLQEAAISTVDISVVFILVTSFHKVLENWSIQNKNLKNSPSVSISKIHKSFCETLKALKCLRASNATSLLNIHFIDGDVNSWTMWDKIRNEIIKTTRCITSYKIKLIKNRCANLGYLNMFYDSLVFKREINHFYCQACLSLGKLKAFKYFYINVGPEFYSEKCQNLLNQPYGYTNDEIYKIYNFSKPFEANELIEPLTTQTKNVMCMFQYIHIFYWACNDHTINFMLNTPQYFKDSEKLKPLYVPFLVIGYTKEFVAFQGYCPVEYENGKLVKGSMNLSVFYRKKVYLMANIENTHEFLTFPEKYRNIKFDLCSHTQQNGIFRGLSEDIIGNTLLEVSNLRPMHFALDGRLSATTFIALKLQFLNSCPKYSDFWHTLVHNFSRDCKKLNEEMKKYQQNLNRLKDDPNETNI